MRSGDKYRLLHSVAARADDDTTQDGAYLTAYEEVDIDDLHRGIWSVEHVLPRSMTGDNAHARSDPVGWVEAVAAANSRRSNTPLYLWASEEAAVDNSEVRGHYVPPMTQRARLARKWLFVRATYSGLDPPSRLQAEHFEDIIELVRAHPVQEAERKVNSYYRSSLGWANPLIERDADSWYCDPAWRDMVLAAQK